ncbi:MAG: glycosyltransferase [Chloroflexota bacterium]
MKVSLICTVLNEGQSIQRLLDSLQQQTRLPDEIVFVDGGSTDETVQVLEQHPLAERIDLRVIVEPGANISRGRNIAIAAANGPIIASTDAGVRLDRNWLAELVNPFENGQAPQVVSGFFVPDTQSPFEVAMGATVLPMIEDINPATFLPSSRSIAFLKSDWKAIGGYPEWLDFCEDLIFDFRLKDQVGSFQFAPKAVVYFQPRTSLRAFYKQYYQYARGDGKADLWRKRHAIRYITYLIALPLLILLGALVSPWWWLIGAIIGSFGLFYTPYKRLVQQWHSLSIIEKVVSLYWVPIIRITGDIAKMVGYPVGWQWRLARLGNQPELRWKS